MKIKKISAQTQVLLDQAQQHVVSEVAATEEKINNFKEDLKRVKSLGLSQTSVQALNDALLGAKTTQKNLVKRGLSQQLENVITLASAKNAKAFENMFNAVNRLFGKKFNSGVKKELERLAIDLDNLLQNTTTRIQKIEKDNKAVPADVLHRIKELETHVQQAEFFNTTAEALKVFSPDPIENLSTCSDYPQPLVRARLADHCLTSARDEWSNVSQYPGEMDMIVMFACDALNHYTLGVELLKGDPQKIEQAADMDTASREGLHHDVWDFANYTVCNKQIFGAEAIKKYRIKKEEQQAQHLNRKITREVASPARPEKSRKM